MTRRLAVVVLMLFAMWLLGSPAGAQEAEAPVLKFLGVPSPTEAPPPPLPWLVPYAFVLEGYEGSVSAAKLDLWTPTGLAKDPPVVFTSPTSFIVWLDRLQEPDYYTVILTFADGTSLTSYFLHHGVASGQVHALARYRGSLGPMVTFNTAIDFVVGEEAGSVAQVSVTVPCGSGSATGRTPLYRLIPIVRGRWEWNSEGFSIRAVFLPNQMVEGYVRVWIPEGQRNFRSCDSGWLQWRGVDPRQWP